MHVFFFFLPPPHRKFFGAAPDSRGGVGCLAHLKSLQAKIKRKEMQRLSRLSSFFFSFTRELSIRAGREGEDGLKNSLQNTLSGSSGAPVRQRFFFKIKIAPCHRKAGTVSGDKKKKIANKQESRFESHVCLVKFTRRDRPVRRRRGDVMSPLLSADEYKSGRAGGWGKRRVNTFSLATLK